MRSGELARIAGVSSDTLRHYERLGLLPKAPRTANGYREFSPFSVERVRIIRRALGIGFSLPELVTILSMRSEGKLPCQHARDLAQSKLQSLDRQMAELVALHRQLKEILRNWDLRLRRAGKHKPARLLESLPEGTAQFTRAQFKHFKNGRGHENNFGGSGIGNGSRRAANKSTSKRG